MFSVTARCVIAIHISATLFPPRRQIRCQPERHTGRPFRHTGRMPMRAEILAAILAARMSGESRLFLARPIPARRISRWSG